MTNIELKILNKIVNLLKNSGYNKIQYIPTSFSFLAIIKEYQNIFNFFF